MICSVCRHCGLCEGSETKKNVSVLADFSGLENLKGDNSLPLNFVGIAFDIGTTSIAANIFSRVKAFIMDMFFIAAPLLYIMTYPPASLRRTSPYGNN